MPVCDANHFEFEDEHFYFASRIKIWNVLPIVTTIGITGGWELVELFLCSIVYLYQCYRSQTAFFSLTNLLKISIIIRILHHQLSISTEFLLLLWFMFIWFIKSSFSLSKVKLSKDPTTIKKNVSDKKKHSIFYYSFRNQPYQRVYSILCYRCRTNNLFMLSINTPRSNSDIKHSYFKGIRGAYYRMAITIY